MEKLYDRIDWNNNTSPALNDTNLNLMSKAVDDIDDRVVDIAGTVMETVPQIQGDLEEAQDLLEDAEAISTHPPIIGQNGNWWTWDTTIEDYADSGIDAGVSLTIGTTSTLTPGSDATVTNSGTATDPILNFGIPAGVAGQNGQDGHGVPSGGTTGQVLKKASGTDYDTEWANESGGSGGHTILNGSGTAMTQRAKLQFDGLNVSDDSGNDKTVVTAPAPDYVDIQYTPSASWTKGQTCISGNKRYRCKVNNTGSAYAPPNATYWEELSVANEISNVESIFSNAIQTELTPDTSLKRLYWFNKNQYNNSMDFVNFNNNNNTGITSYNKTSDGMKIAIRSGTWSGVKSKYPVDLSSYKKMWIKVLCLDDARSSDTSLCIQAFLYGSDPSWNTSPLAYIYTTLTDVHSKNKVMCFETDFNGGSSFSSCYVSVAGYDYGGKYYIESIWFSK